jgi:hypothetical protein
MYFIFLRDRRDERDMRDRRDFCGMTNNEHL